MGGRWLPRGMLQIALALLAANEHMLACRAVSVISGLNRNFSFAVAVAVATADKKSVSRQCSRSNSA